MVCRRNIDLRWGNMGGAGIMPKWLIAIGLVANAAHSALTWTGCSDLTDANFKVTTLVSRAADTIDEPMKMAFDLLAQPGEDAKGKVDVYFTQRFGKLRKFDSQSGKV